MIAVTYAVDGPQTPARGRAVSTASRLPQSGTSRSMPMTTTCTGGTDVTSRPLPSLVTSTTLPELATPKLQPLMPMPAERNWPRSTVRA